MTRRRVSGPVRSGIGSGSGLVGSGSTGLAAAGTTAGTSTTSPNDWSSPFLWPVLLIIRKDFTSGWKPLAFWKPGLGIIVQCWWLRPWGVFGLLP